MNASKIIFQIEKTRTGYSAYSNELPIFSTGKTINQLLQNLDEALELYFEDAPRKKVQYHIQFSEFFLHYRILNAKILAERIGLHPTLLSQYIRGIKPLSSDQALRIIKGIQQIGKELSSFSFERRIKTSS